MTTYLALEDPDFFVVGITGKTPKLEMFDALKDCDLVYLCLDPDVFAKNRPGGKSPVRRLIDYFKDRSRIISLPYKIDDMIAEGVLDQKALRSLIKDARKINYHG